jgi:nitroimidazol reductase NimA-like FMN-containing flavoprotein (pyridoxamine 5'-phosphate oxidase superfamily)
MSALTMTKDEREAFLADVHVGMIGIADSGRAPLTVPIWYAYEPGGLVTIVTERGSRKAALIGRENRFSLCAQTETAPYKYVSVEGPVVATEQTVDAGELRALARRYLGEALGDAYAAAAEREISESVTIRMRPERWLTVDYTKQFA